MSLPLALLLFFLVGSALGWGFFRLVVLLLFHPSRRISVLGIGLPLTPSLWQRRREGFAESVGAIFAEEFSRGDLIRERLGDPELRRDLERNIEARLAAFVETPFDRLFADSDVSPAPSALATRSLGRILSSAELSAALRAALQEALRALKGLPLSVVLPPERGEALVGSLLSETSLRALSDRLQAWFANRSDSRGGGEGEAGGALLRREGEGEKETLIAGLLPASVLSPLVGLLVEALYTASIPAVEAFLNDIDTRERLERSANEIVRRAVGRLGPLQRMIVGAANYESNIAQAMPETIEDLVSMISSILRSPSTRDRARDEGVQGWETAGQGKEGLWGRLSASISREALWRAISLVLARLVERRPEIGSRTSSLLVANGKWSFGALVEGLEPRGSENSEAAVLDFEALLGQGGGIDILLQEAREVFASSFMEGLRARSPASLLGLGSEEVAQLSSWIATRGLSFVDAEADAIAGGLGLRAMVVEKLGSIDNSRAKEILGAALGKSKPLFPLAFALLGGAVGLVDLLIIKLMGGHF